MMAAYMLLRSLGSSFLLLCKGRGSTEGPTGPALSLLPSYQGSQSCLNNAVSIEQHGGMPALLRYVQFTLLWSVGKLASDAAAV